AKSRCSLSLPLHIVPRPSPPLCRGGLFQPLRCSRGTTYMAIDRLFCTPSGRRLDAAERQAKRSAAPKSGASVANGGSGSSLIILRLEQKQLCSRKAVQSMALVSLFITAPR